VGLVTICGARAEEPNEGERDREKMKKEKGDKNEWIKTKNLIIVLHVHQNDVILVR
jgi:hypothetical protein